MVLNLSLYNIENLHNIWDRGERERVMKKLKDIGSDISIFCVPETDGFTPTATTLVYVSRFFFPCY